MPPVSPIPTPAYRSTVVSLAIGQVVSWAALYYAFSSFVLPMQRHFGWTKPELMGAFTAGLAVWGATSYAVGAAIDRGRGRAVLAGGAALAGIGFLLWSRVEGLPMLYATWALLGAAMAMTLYDPAFTVLTKRFPDRYVRGITTLTLVGGFASTLSFPACAWLIGALGWRGALASIGLVLLLGVAPLHLWALRGPSHGNSTGASKPAGDATLGDALRQRAFWLLTASMTFYAFAAAAMWAHMMPAFAAKGLTEAEALAVVVWFGPAQVLGRLLHFLFGRGIAPRRLGLVVLGGMPVSLALFALSDQLVALLVFALLFGFANGLVTIVRGSIVPDYFGREHVGRIGGAMSGISLLARAAAPLATAWLLVALGGYPALLLVLSGVGLASLIAFAMARRPGGR